MSPAAAPAVGCRLGAGGISCYPPDDVGSAAEAPRIELRLDVVRRICAMRVVDVPTRRRHEERSCRAKPAIASSETYEAQQSGEPTTVNASVHAYA